MENMKKLKATAFSAVKKLMGDFIVLDVKGLFVLIVTALTRHVAGTK